MDSGKAPPLAAEDRVGPYRVLRKLGEGGMGVVFEAIHDGIERRVAIKVMRRDLARQSDIAGRFFNEARAVNRIAHPGLVQISEFGHLPDGSAYIVMELLVGQSLAQRLIEIGGQMSAEEVIEVSAQVADSLRATHEKGIVHRDLKPENVMLILEPKGVRTKVLDFGIAKLQDSADSEAPRTRTEAVLGTPQYMSPEQCKGPRNVDEKADVYSLGVMLYRMLSGQLPFTGEGPGEIIAKQIYEDPPPLAELLPEVLPSLAALVHRMLCKSRERRPSMAQVVAELETLRQQHPWQGQRHSVVESPSAKPVAGSAAAEIQPSLLSLVGQAHSVSHNRRRALLIVAVGLTLSVALTMTALKLGRPDAIDRVHGAGPMPPRPSMTAAPSPANEPDPLVPTRKSPAVPPVQFVPLPARPVKISTVQSKRRSPSRANKLDSSISKKGHERPQVED